MRIICCRFGTKFTDWHVNNLKHMIDNYSGLSYDSFEVIENDIYGNWYNKLQMYDMFRDGENLYFDLDVCIFDKLRPLAIGSSKEQYKLASVCSSLSSPPLLLLSLTGKSTGAIPTFFNGTLAPGSTGSTCGSGKSSV